MISNELSEAIANCNRDPIHIPGAIQSFGTLVASDLHLKSIQAVAENVSEYFKKDYADLVGRKLDEIVGTELRHAARNALGHETIKVQREVLPAVQLKGADHQVTIHQKGDLAILEFLPERKPVGERFLPFEKVRSILTPRRRNEHIDDDLAEIAEILRSILGYDRVKLYRFLADGSGEVRAESRHPDMPSFLGHRFPASDIPPIARELYARTPLRVLHDITAPDVPLYCVSSHDPIDLSLAILRGKDPVHQAYLINMGINATLTIPLVVDDALWGLFACHHRTPKVPDPAVLTAAELAGKFVSLRLQRSLEANSHVNQLRASNIANRLLVTDDSVLSVTSYWEMAKTELQALIPSDGVALVFGDAFETMGDVPDRAACDALFLAYDGESEAVGHFSDLPRRLPGAKWGKTAGALCINVPGVTDLRFIYFRNRSEMKITWAGKPAKDVEWTERGPILTPRHSFQTYVENVEGRSDEWTIEEIAVANIISKALSRAAAQQSELRDNRNRMGLLVRELNHRVRNILSLVQSLTSLTAPGTTSVAEYAATLEKRILALAGAHNILTRTNMAGVTLRDLLTLELRPFNGRSGRVTLSGDDLAFRPDAATILALVFHELASNATKYGALSVQDGRVNVSWSLGENGVEIVWTETEGPETAPPTRRGFGISIIEDSIPFELRGRATLDIRSTGVVATFWLPGEFVADSASAASSILSLTESLPRNGSNPAEPHTDRVLIVEDNFVLALATKRLLSGEGFTQTDIAGTIEEASSLIQNNEYKLCLLDINLQGVYSTPIARLLSRNGMPFVFVTGYGSEGSEITEDFNAPVLSKPIAVGEFRQIIKSLTKLD